jgi:hypothetical protein
MSLLYTPNVWEDEVLGSNERYDILEDGGTPISENVQVNLISTVVQAGTAVDATKMNNIEDGLAALDTRLADNTDFLTTGGTSTAYTLTTAGVQALATGEMFRVKFHATAGATPTLNRDAKGAKALKYYNAVGAKTAVSATTLIANMISNVIYDGTDYVVLDALPLAMTAPSKLLGRSTAGAGVVEEIGLDSDHALSGGNLRMGAFSGDVSKAAGALATSIVANAVTNAKLAQMANATVKGRNTAGTGDPEDVTMAQLLALLGIAEGSYTPTATAVANLTSTSGVTFYYYKVGTRVTVWGGIAVDPTTAGVECAVRCTLPFASNLSAYRQLIGGCGRTGAYDEVGTVQGDTTNDEAEIRFMPGNLVNHNINVWFSYVIA